MVSSLSPFFFGGGVKGNVHYSSYALWKARTVVYFLLAIIELFSLGVTTEALRANIDWKSAFSLQLGQFAPKFQVEVVAPTNHSSCRKTRMNDLSCGIRMWAQVFFFLSQCMRLIDRQTGRQTNGQKCPRNTIDNVILTRSLAIAKRPCDCFVCQFWSNSTGIRYFAEIIGLSSSMWRNWSVKLPNSVK